MSKNSKTLNGLISLVKEDAEVIFNTFDLLPMCTTIWNHKNEIIFFNKEAITLFGLKSKENFPKNFYELSPEMQPDNRLSVEAGADYCEQAKKDGAVKFHWLHKTLDGKEIPTEVTLALLNPEDKENSLLAGFTTDLRPQFAGNNEAAIEESFFFDQISDKILFNTVAELAAEWFWTCNVRTSTIQFFGKGREILALSSEKYAFPEDIVASGMVHEEDVETFLAFAKSAKEGISRPCDVRFIQPNGTTRYYRIVYKNFFSKQGDPLYVIGKTYDIHDQKSYEMLSQTDQLTNCFNKVTTETLSKKAINDFPNNNHALFIIDVDNFKAINDNLGHHFGDIVLTDISNKLRSHFRDGDIIGRIGGDEFVVFLKNIRDINIIKSKAESIAKTFQNTYSGDNYDYKISGSIGIALYPTHSTNFEELYKCADKALYQSKKRGKDCFTFYETDFVHSSIKDLTIVENANRAGSSFVDSELVNAIFDSIYDSKTIHTSIDGVLAIIGTKLNVDRAHVFVTDSDDEGVYHITNEWHSSRVKSRLDKIRIIKREALGEIFDLLDEKETIYFNGVDDFKSQTTKDFILNQGAKSNLILQAQNQSTLKLGLALADCTKERVWTEKEVNTMRYAVKLISIFKLSEKAQKIRMSEKEAMNKLTQEEVDALQTLMLKGVISSE